MRKSNDKQSIESSVKNGNIYRGSKKQLVEVDYWHKLNASERAWLEKFNDEYVNGRFPVKVVHLHKTKALKRDCNNRSNQIRRDVVYVFKKVGLEGY